MKRTDLVKTLEKIGALTILDEIEDAKVRIKKINYVKLKKSVDEIHEILPEIERRSPKQIVILLEILSNKEGEVAQSELLKSTNSSQSSLKSLQKKFADREDR